MAPFFLGLGGLLAIAVEENIFDNQTKKTCFTTLLKYSYLTVLGIPLQLLNLSGYVVVGLTGVIIVMSLAVVLVLMRILCVLSCCRSSRIRPSAPNKNKGESTLIRELTDLLKRLRLDRAFESAIWLVSQIGLGLDVKETQRVWQIEV